MSPHQKHHKYLKNFIFKEFDVDEIVDYGRRGAPDYELLNEADADVFPVAQDWVQRYQPTTDAVVFGLDMLTFDFDDVYKSNNLISILIAGYVFDNVAAAEKYVDWYVETWEKLNSVTKDIANKDRPSVFYTGFSNNVTEGDVNKTLRAWTEHTVGYQAVKLAGGYNIIDENPSINENNQNIAGTSTATIDLEWISEQKYDYVFAHCTKYQGSGNVSFTVPGHGYIWPDDVEYKTGQKHLGTVDVLKGSCKPENMHLTPGDYMNGAFGGLLSAILVAQVISADKFPDLNLMDEHQKYIDMMGFNWDLREKGIFFVEN